VGQPFFISAIGTPLTEAETLHRDGLAAHLDDQWRHGIDGVLVAGTMGLMPLLTDRVYEDLVRASVELSAGRGEVMIGAGDCSFARTKARLELLNQYPIDGAVILTPYFMRFCQAELIDYYRALADVSRAPVYLYDLPQRTGSKIELATGLELSRHKNIRGIKCSDEPTYARRILDRVDPDQFRVIVAQPLLVDALLRFGVMQHLDGLFSIAPQWTTPMGRSAIENEWDQAREMQLRLIRLQSLLAEHGVFQSMTAILNARGVPGNFAPKPFAAPSDAETQAILSAPIVRELIND
jgi:4-hydroxy-tetrahydrodipicolinate synthase